MQANAGRTIVDILSRDQEQLPEWLASDSRPTFDRKTFFASRTVYYPGYGDDGQPVKLCALSHAAHTFVFVDQAVKWETIVERLDDREQGFRGYEILCQQRIAEDALRPGGWSPHVSEQEVSNSGLFVSDFSEPFGLFVVLERKGDCGEDHGPWRLATLFIGGDGFASYDALYCQEDGTPSPYLVVIQDCGFGGDFDRFGKDGLLERIARRCSVRPKYLLVGEPSKQWTGYEDTGARSELGGSPPHPRRLFRRQEGSLAMTGDPGRDTLLAHLAWRLSNQHEDIAVEALGFILRSDATRKTLQQVIRDGGANIGPIAHVATQVSGEEGTRPDLVGCDQRGEESVLIEAKFWAGLTHNQPKAYLDRLAKGKALLFVAPALRMEALWVELCKQTKVDVPDSADHKSEVKSVETSEQKRLMLTSWAHLLERLELAGDELANFAIRELRGLANRVDESSFPPLRAEELAPSLARRLLGLRKLVDDATTRGLAAGFVDTRGLNVASKPTGYGRYLRIAGIGAWFGLDFSRWALGSYPSTPLWLWFEDWGNERVLLDVRAAMRSRIQANPPRCFDEESRIVVPIGLPDRVEYETVLNDVVEQLESVAKEIRGC